MQIEIEMEINHAKLDRGTKTLNCGKEALGLFISGDTTDIKTEMILTDK